MKHVGIVRSIDLAGRIVLPIELRKHMKIATGDDVEIYVEGNSIVLKKYESTCIFCGNTENLVDLNDKNVCKECRDKLAQM